MYTARVGVQVHNNGVKLSAQVLIEGLSCHAVPRVRPHAGLTAERAKMYTDNATSPVHPFAARR